MQKVLLLVVVLLLVLGAVAFADTDEEMVPSQIQAVGQALVKADPDTGQLWFTVNVEKPDLAAARAEAARLMTNVLDEIKALNLTGLALSTESVSVTQLYAPLDNADSTMPYFPNDTKRELVGYRVTNSASATLKGSREALQSGISSLIDVALTSGAVEMSGPYFSLVNDGPARRQALEKATRDAALNAQAIAKGLEVEIEGYSFASMYQAQPMPMMKTMAAESFGGMGGGAPSPVEVSEVEIDATVYVTATY